MMTDTTTEAKEDADAAAKHFGKRDDVMFARTKTLTAPGRTATHVVEIEFEEGVPFKTYDAVVAAFDAIGADRINDKRGAMIVVGEFHDSDWREA